MAILVPLGGGEEACDRVAARTGLDSFERGFVSDSGSLK
jgi:hypothetical protein